MSITEIVEYREDEKCFYLYNDKDQIAQMDVDDLLDYLIVEEKSLYSLAKNDPCGLIGRLDGKYLLH